MQTLLTIATADWGPAIHRAARVVAAFALLVFVIAADLAAITYRAGKATGEALGKRSDQLAVLFVRVLAAQPAAAPSPAPAQPAAAAGRQRQARPTPPHLRALREERDRLEGMTQRQLMALAGTRRKLSKPQLVAMLRAA